jgi:hypothetical protein
LRIGKKNIDIMAFPMMPPPSDQESIIDCSEFT